MAISFSKEVLFQYFEGSVLTKNLRTSFSAFVGFVVLTTLVRKNSVFWDIKPFNPLKVDLATGFHAEFLIYLFFNPEDGGDIVLQNVS